MLVNQLVQITGDGLHVSLEYDGDARRRGSDVTDGDGPVVGAAAQLRAVVVRELHYTHLFCMLMIKTN